MICCIHVCCSYSQSKIQAYLYHSSIQACPRDTTKTTLANITKWPLDVIKAIDALLKGGRVSKTFEDAFDVLHNKDHVAAVLGMMDQLGLLERIASKTRVFVVWCWG
ncbi:MAG: hypothetical protein OXE77_01750 [Flavobacteriaceae bacterium]|nr:hypothetical protein [Flavobacteriaceae bacterium]MCY4267874.1 hypothetical protein [Flavobacteriaceae bacterium]